MPAVGGDGVVPDRQPTRVGSRPSAAGEGPAPTHPDAATQQARQALAVFENLGASIDVDQMHELLRSLGARTRTGPKGVGTLTSRERQVLALLAAGLSNPQIAQRLHVSPKTASHHVSSILVKLGLRNRAQAAAEAAAVLGEPARHTRS